VNGNISDDGGPSIPETFNISGYKLNASNASNITGVSGWMITLNNITPGKVTENTLTGSSGEYMFMGLPNGTYNVTEEMRTGWTNISPMSLMVTINGADMMNENSQMP